jgi:site-specific recombinase XerD
MNIGKYAELYSEDLKVKNYSESTIENYVSQVKMFLYYFNDKVTKPSEISERMIKDWLLQAKSINGRKHRLSALKLFYTLTGKQPLKFRHIEYPRVEKKLPEIISKEKIIEATAQQKQLKYIPMFQPL